MAQSYNTAFDQLSASLAEGFLPFVDDNIGVSNMVFQEGWEHAKSVPPSRFLAANIRTSRNQNAGAFGEFDNPDADPQTILSTAAYTWSWYVCSIIMSYQLLRSVQGKFQRINLIATQVEDGVEALSNVIGTDLTNYSTKGKNFGSGYNALGIVEASDPGTTVNLYGGITRTGTGSFANWPGQSVGGLSSSNIGSGSTNDPAWRLFVLLYTACSIGGEYPDVVYTTKEGIEAYMYVQAANQRVSPGDAMQVGFSGAWLFKAKVMGDEHIINPTRSTFYGANYFAINHNHTGFYYFGKKGFDFIDWVDAKDVVGKLSRYVTVLQYVSTQPRLNGQLLYVNQLVNL